MMKKSWIPLLIIALTSACILYYHYTSHHSHTTHTTTTTGAQPMDNIPYHRIHSIPVITTDPPNTETFSHDNDISTTLTSTESSINDTNKYTISRNTETDSNDVDFLSSFKQGYVYDKFTIVMPTYKRTENLFMIMDKYCPMDDIIDQIIILWNNIGRPLPGDLTARAEQCAVHVWIRVMEKNNLTSRFYPYSQIRTAGVMSLDDDNLINRSSLELVFRTFQKYPHRLVGYDARSFSVSHNRYQYSFKTNPYTVILTNRGLMHYKYLKLFSSIPKKVMDFVVEHKNGEDLAMNVVIGKYLKDNGQGQCVGVRVKTSIKALNNYSKEKYGGLSRRSSHINDRHKCFQLLADEYGDLHNYLPECTLVINELKDI